jgi:hypothetical protein
VLLAKGAKLLKVPTLLTTGLRKIQGLVHEVQAVFPEQWPIDRTNLNAFDACYGWLVDRELPPNVGSIGLVGWL